jgi:hypothetical protein
VVPLAIDLNVQASLTHNDGKIKVVLLNTVLGQ